MNAKKKYRNFGAKVLQSILGQFLVNVRPMMHLFSGINSFYFRMDISIAIHTVSTPEKLINISDTNTTGKYTGQFMTNRRKHLKNLCPSGKYKITDIVIAQHNITGPK